MGYGGDYEPIGKWGWFWIVVIFVVFPLLSWLISEPSDDYDSEPTWCYVDPVTQIPDC